mgnify:CR=1 FL=1
MQQMQMPEAEKNKYIVMFSSWIFYVFQIIKIISYTLADVDYYQGKTLTGDICLFLLYCCVCSLLTFSVIRNKFKFYLIALILSALFDIIVVFCLVFIIMNYSLGKDAFLIVIKIIELLPGILFFINPKLIVEAPNNNNNNAQNVNPILNQQENNN